MGIANIYTHRYDKWLMTAKQKVKDLLSLENLKSGTQKEDNITQVCDMCKTKLTYKNLFTFFVK